MMAAPRILLNITHGFQARMLLRTEIAERLLASGATLIVVAPNVDEPYFRGEFNRSGFVLEPMPRRYGLVERLLVNMRIYFLMNPELGGTYNHKRERYRRNHPVRYWVSRIINLGLGRVRLVRRAYLALESRIFNGSEYDELLARHRPDLIVAGTPGFNVYDAHLLRAGHRAGIPTTTVMLSWDNLTSKGYMGAQPDSLLVWSDLMRDEAIRYHDFAGPIVEVGAAQFDIYPQVAGESDPRAFKRAHRISPSSRLIVWGTINSDLYPNQLELLRQYVEWFNSSDESRYLWIRLHPQSISGTHEWLLEGFKALAGPRVRVEVPPVMSEQLRWDLPATDMEHLARLLLAADLLITPQSTLTIDAACAGTPIINLAIDANFAGAIEYTHYQNIIKHRGVWVVSSFEELVSATEGYLEDSTLHLTGRRAIVGEQLGRWYGAAGRRTQEVLLDLAGREVRDREPARSASREGESQ